MWSQFFFLIPTRVLSTLRFVLVVNSQIYHSTTIKISKTCHQIVFRMLVTVEPLISEEEFVELEKDMDEFQKGDGQKLHKILQAR